MLAYHDDPTNCASSHLPTRSALGADDPWSEFLNASLTMKRFFDHFANLSRISARFAAGLVHAGALSELARLAAKPKHCGQAGEDGAGASAADIIAQAENAFVNCFVALGRSFPQVSHRRCSLLGVFSVDICLRLLSTPITHGVPKVGTTITSLEVNSCCCCRRDSVVKPC